MKKTKIAKLDFHHAFLLVWPVRKIRFYRTRSEAGACLRIGIRQRYIPHVKFEARYI